eukprot:RCo037071
MQRDTVRMNNIPEDILGHVLSFGWSPKYCLVCKRWSELTHLRHVHIEERHRLDLRNLEQWGPVSLRFNCDTLPGFKDFFFEAGSLPMLQRLMLAPRLREVDEKVGIILTLLARYSSLTFFEIDFCEAMFAPSVLELLAATFTRLPNLRAMVLSLMCSPITPENANELFLLGGLQALERLYLNLHRCSLNAEALRHLIVALRLMPRLTDLTIEMELTTVNKEGHGPAAEALSLLRDAPALTSLHIDAASSDMNAVDAEHLSRLKRCPCLRRLTLDLGGNGVETEGFGALMGVLKIPTLTACTLNVTSNRVCPPF